MENGGNAKVNGIFEAKLDNPSTKPTTGASGPVRERFIRDKYERRKYYDPIVLQNYTNISAPAAAPLSSSSAGAVSTTARRTPSEVAKLRAQTRRSQSLPIESWNSTSKKHSVAAPTPAQPEMDLLDFSAPIAMDPGSPPNPPSAAPSPTLDLFKNMSMAMCGGGGAASTTDGGGATAKNDQSLPGNTNGMNHVAPQRETTKKMTSEEILAMFHAPSVPQQQQFGNFSHFNNNMNSNMVGSGGMSGMDMMYNQNQGMMQQSNNMFAGMQQQQQQSHSVGMAGGMFGMNNNMSMGQYHTQNNSFGVSTNMMQQQHPLQPMGGNPSNSNMMGGTGMTMAYNSSMGVNSMGHQGYQGNSGSTTGNLQNGSDNAFGDFMGGSSKNNNHRQFASFGSFH